MGPLKLNKMEFEVIGYFREYWVDGKMYGTKECNKPEDGLTGYLSRKDHTAQENIVFKKKTIKKGQAYYTRTFPLNGRLKKQ